MMSTKEQKIRSIIHNNFKLKSKRVNVVSNAVNFIMDKTEIWELDPDYIIRIFLSYMDYIISRETASTVLDYYENEDFIDNYGYHLLVDGSKVKTALTQSLCRYLYFNDYTNNPFPETFIKDKTLDEILDWLRDNYYEYIETYHSYYVGSYSIDSIGFGEQCEQVSGMYNHITELEIDPNFMLDAFEDKGFYIPDNKSDFVYYDLSDSGVQINLESFIDEWIDQLIEEYNLNSK